MTRHLKIAALSTGALLMTSAASMALTADQVWAGWQETAAGLGLSLIAESQTSEGGVLTLNGVTLGEAIPSSADSPELATTQIVMTEQAGGSVAITMAPSLTAAYTGDIAGSLSINQTGLVLTAKDAGAGTAYDFTADRLGVVSDSTYPVDMYDGSEPQEGSVKLDLGFTAVSGSYADTPGDDRTFALVLNAGSLVYDLSQKDPFIPSDSTATSDTKDIALTANLTMPSGMNIMSDDPAAWGQALRDGLALDVSMKTGNSVGTAVERGEFMAYDLDMSGGASEITTSVSAAGLTATAKASNIVYAGSSPSIPVERIELTIGPSEMDFRMPLIASVPEDYRLMYNLSGITINEEAWALVDPGQTLPRTPASLLLDVNGKAALDVFALAAAEESGAVPPVPVIESLNMPALSVMIAGATLSGTGAFTFDNSVGYPAPRGKADLTLVGGNALIDGLVAIGLVPEDQAQGARMMMAMFMTPGAGPDELMTTIEARDDNGIYVNGQRIQ
jgi:hypothetical protein